MQDLGVRVPVLLLLIVDVVYHARLVSANIDDRMMHELYLWPSADAVKANVASVMCSYNKVNSTYACENDKLMNGL